MNRFAFEFLSAPLLLDRIEKAWRRTTQRARLANEMYGMSDRELSDLRMSRADIPYALEHVEKAA